MREGNLLTNSFIDLGMLGLLSFVVPKSTHKVNRGLRRGLRGAIKAKLAADVLSDVSSEGYVNVFDVVEGAGVAGETLKHSMAAKDMGKMFDVLKAGGDASKVAYNPSALYRLRSALAKRGLGFIKPPTRVYRDIAPQDILRNLSFQSFGKNREGMRDVAEELANKIEDIIAVKTKAGAKVNLDRIVSDAFGEVSRAPKYKKYAKDFEKVMLKRVKGKGGPDTFQLRGVDSLLNKEMKDFGIFSSSSLGNLSILHRPVNKAQRVLLNRLKWVEKVGESGSFGKGFTPANTLQEIATSPAKKLIGNLRKRYGKIAGDTGMSSRSVGNTASVDELIKDINGVKNTTKDLKRLAESRGYTNSLYDIGGGLGFIGDSLGVKGGAIVRGSDRYLNETAPLEEFRI